MGVSVNVFETIWGQLRKGAAYRAQFAAASFKRSVPLQIRALRKARGWSQAQLAERAGLTQGVVSRAENANYGNLTVNTILSIAAGFDCAFVGRFVAFSGMAQWLEGLAESQIHVPSFEDDRPSPARDTTNLTGSVLPLPGTGNALSGTDGLDGLRSRPRQGEAGMEIKPPQISLQGGTLSEPGGEDRRNAKKLGLAR